MKFRVLVPQKIAQEGIRLLEENGASIVVPPSYDEDTLVKYVRDVDAIIARTEIYSQKILQNANRLKIIARHGIGVDNIDVNAATKHRIKVTNTPSANINAVAELVLTFMLASTRHLLSIDHAVRDGNFDIRNRLFGYELKDKTLGIIGFGNIGRLIAEKCKFGLGMNIVVFDPYVNAESVESYVELTESLEDLLRVSNVITLHVPYIDATHHLINKNSFHIMKKDAILINAARGGVVDEEALVEALMSEEIRGACVDVFEEEPPREENPLFKLENVIVTPHLGAQTHEAFKQMAIDAANEIISVKNGKCPENLIHPVTT
ncbi:hydroxyacid dehydrogenase [Oceanobacillus sp. 1P07AA]|uniref:hydroxyacid dehydrogenase n=1 Tax=Oceanobacillus sp. 1P07AA TaxID=3132293 RepID=UPI0039A77753